MCQELGRRCCTPGWAAVVLADGLGELAAGGREGRERRQGARPADGPPELPGVLTAPPWTRWRHTRTRHARAADAQRRAPCSGASVSQGSSGHCGLQYIASGSQGHLILPTGHAALLTGAFSLSAGLARRRVLACQLEIPYGDCPFPAWERTEACTTSLSNWLLL